MDVAGEDSAVGKGLLDSDRLQVRVFISLLVQTNHHTNLC